MPVDLIIGFPCFLSEGFYEHVILSRMFHEYVVAKGKLVGLDDGSWCGKKKGVKAALAMPMMHVISRCR